MNSRTHKSAVMVKLISSQLGADRTDYLLRDSMMTGAGYGHFVLDWLIWGIQMKMLKENAEN